MKSWNQRFYYDTSTNTMLRFQEIHLTQWKSIGIICSFIVFESNMLKVSIATWRWQNIWLIINFSWWKTFFGSFCFLFYEKNESNIFHFWSVLKHFLDIFLSHLLFCFAFSLYRDCSYSIESLFDYEFSLMVKLQKWKLQVKLWF